jgi:nucleoside-diphosphate-sugar epimerase
MAELRGRRILVTGPAGQIAFPLARDLARHNEVWGIARFSQPGSRERVEAAGISVAEVDLAAPEWRRLPEHFDYVLHLAVLQQEGLDYDRALAVNAEGTGLLMSRFRRARACLVVSTCGVYASPADPWHAIREGDPLGVTIQPYSPTYAVSKIAEEGVARFACREWELPTTIARMNVSYGPNGGLPAYQFEAILAGQAVPVQVGRASVCNPIDERDIDATVPGLLEVARVPARILNWSGDDAVEVEEYCRYMAELAGLPVRFEQTREGAIHHFRLDNSERQRLVGPCKVAWRQGLRDMVAARHPELALRDPPA